MFSEGLLKIVSIRDYDRNLKEQYGCSDIRGSTEVTSSSIHSEDCRSYKVLIISGSIVIPTKHCRTTQQ